MDRADAAKGAVVLIVEDEALVRMSAADILQEAGFHVVESRDGMEAVALLEIRDDVAAMFTDIAMPNMNGLDLAKIVSERWPQVGMVLSSGALPEGVPQKLPNHVRFLAKPYTPRKLVQAIEAVLPETGRPVTIKSQPTLPPGREFGAGGIAHPLPEPEE